MTDERPKKILVIRLGALGDFVLSTGLFKAIRRHHPEASLTLLTTAPYGDIARQSKWFDEIWIIFHSRVSIYAITPSNAASDHNSSGASTPFGTVRILGLCF